MAKLRSGMFIKRSNTFDKVEASKKREFGRKVERGLKRAGLFLQRESQMRVPVDTGNLRNSAFTRVEEGSGLNVVVLVGYTANYAVFVHENMNAHHNVGEAKFLSGPAKSKLPEMRRIVREEAGLP